MWLHGIEIHLVISSFSAGAAFGLLIGMILWWIEWRDK